MPAPPVRLHMQYLLPFTLEHKICTKFGFAIEKKIFNDRIIFVKRRPEKGDKKIFVMGKIDNDPPPMTVFQERKLFQRCEAIVDFYPEPNSAVPAIRQRLHNLAQSLPMREQKFVEDFIEANWPEKAKV